MAADSREPLADSSPLPAETPSSRKKPKRAFTNSQEGKLWEEFGNPEEPINLLPGGTYNSAGGKPKEVTLMDTIKSLPISDFASFYKTPCARDSLLVGIGTGFGVGSIRGILGGR
jgi:cytochrome c oxidase assembly protein subunit 20